MTKQIFRATFPLAMAALAPGATAEAPADDKPYQFNFVASTQATDSYGRIVIQDFDLSRYEGNPVLLWNHNQLDYKDVIASFPIGFTEGVTAESGKLTGRGNLVNKFATPLAEYARQGVHQKSIRAISIGWECGEITITPDGDLIMTKNTLVEISLCAIGANPEALIQNEATFASLRALASKQKEEKNMKQIARILGLPETAAEPEVEAAASALVLAKNAHTAKIAELEEKAAKVDALQAEIASIHASKDAEALEEILTAGRAAGKLSAENETQCRAICGEGADGKGLDLAKFKNLVENVLKPTINVKQASTRTDAANAEQAHGLTPAQLASCVANGWDPAVYAKTLAANKEQILGTDEGDAAE